MFALYAPERIKNHPGENKTENMYFKIDWSTDIFATYLVMPYLKKENWHY